MIEYINKEKKKGVSGIMRIKNDAQFIEASVDSCIDALDELIIVWNECSDDSPVVIEKMRTKYPEKIKCYEYKHKVYSISLTKEEYDYAKSLPLDSPNLLCNYYNFALSKVGYEYAVKIDADQIYFTDQLRYWCDIYRNDSKYTSWRVIPGFIVWIYFKLLKNVGNKLRKVLPLYPVNFSTYFEEYYKEYVKYAITHHSAQISLAGLNVCYLEGNWKVTMGKCTDTINILPPYNGTGDHIIFKVTQDTYYQPLDSAEYRSQRSDTYSLIEIFHGAHYPKPVGLFWYHMNTMRPNVFPKLKSVFSENHDYFKSLNEFEQLDYIKDLEHHIDNSLASTNVRALFQFLHQSLQLGVIEKHIDKLKPFEV